MPRPCPAAGCRPKDLQDPCHDRPVKEVPLPPAQCLSSDVVFNKKGQPDLELLRDHLHREGFLSQDLLMDLITGAQELFHKEPNMMKLNDPITLVGDIHGQYYDLVRLLDVGGPVGDTQYLFLGDYVDRGSFAIEVVAFLFATKIRHPKRVRMIRGNHECRQMTSFFNFREECEYKYDITVYNAVMDCFDALPLAATINGKFMAVHGGLSPDLPKIKEITKIDRFCEPPREGLLCDLLWSDPLEPKEGDTKAKQRASPFVTNDVRGCAYFFSFDGAANFLQKNALLSIIRAHEAQLEGYKMHQTNPATGFPAVITIFSAPNYCDVYNNKGAILKFENNTLNILQFNCSPHPYHLPNFMDVLTWSIPFVAEKVMEILSEILRPTAVEEEELPELPTTIQQLYRASLSAEQNSTVELATHLAGFIARTTAAGEDGRVAESTADARDRMRMKVRTIARLARIFKTLREENETVVRLKGVCPGHRLKPGLLLAGKEKMMSELEAFGHALTIDVANETRPGKEGAQFRVSECGFTDDSSASEPDW